MMLNLKLYCTRGQNLKLCDISIIIMMFRSKSFADFNPNSRMPPPSFHEDANAGSSVVDSQRSALESSGGPSPEISLRAASVTNGTTFGKHPSLQSLADQDLPGQDGGFLARAVIAPGVYYFGIVDILQTWSWNKIGERYLLCYFLVYLFQ
jgi:hypothetical protein